MATDSIYQVYRYWLKVEDLRGLEHEVVISKAYLQTFFKKDEKGQRLSFQKVCLSFRDKPKDMYLDAAQAEAVRKVTGTDKFAGWVGKTITLAPANGRIEIYAKPLVKGAGLDMPAKGAGYSTSASTTSRNVPVAVKA